MTHIAQAFEYAGMAKAMLRERFGRAARRRALTTVAQTCKTGDSILLFFPDYRAHNPHQQQLINAMPSGAHYHPGSIRDALWLQSLLPPGVRITFHLHWPEPILRVPVFIAFLADLAQFKARGGRVIWSIHNLYPRNITQAAALARLPRIGILTDQFHLFTVAEKEAAAQLYGFAPAQSFIAPRGSYLNCYPNTVTRTQARAALELDNAALVLCFLGQLRPYKGLPQLLDVFAVLRSNLPHTQLLIAGKKRLRDHTAMRPILRRARAMAGVKLYPHFVPDAAIQHYFNAADVVVLPYDTITNSGAFLLALSFGCCIVAPRLGAIAALATTGKNAILYDPETTGGLQHALVHAAALTPTQRAEMGANALLLAQSMRWEGLAQALVNAPSRAESAAA